MENNRDYILFFPGLNVFEPVVLGDFTLLNSEKVDRIDDYLTMALRNLKGSVLLYKKTPYLKEVNEEIQNFVEFIRFCYFSNNPSYFGTEITTGELPFAENFDAYLVIKKHDDPSFESKINTTNGFSIFSESRDDFITTKHSFIKKINLNKIDFNKYNYDLYNKNIEAIYIYNQVTKKDHPYNFPNKILFCRMSIEMVVSNNPNLDKKNYSELFNKWIDDCIKNSNIKTCFPEIYDLYINFIKCHLFNVKKIINDNLVQIKNKRDDLVHEGKINSNKDNILFYLIWFELFLDFSSTRMPTSKYAVRLIFFLWLMCFRLDKWTTPRTYKHFSPLHTYANIFRLYSKYQEKEILKFHIQGMKNELFTNKSSIIWYKS